MKIHDFIMRMMKMSMGSTFYQTGHIGFCTSHYICIKSQCYIYFLDKKGDSGPIWFLPHVLSMGIKHSIMISSAFAANSATKCTLGQVFWNPQMPLTTHMGFSCARNNLLNLLKRPHLKFRAMKYCFSFSQLNLPSV